MRILKSEIENEKRLAALGAGRKARNLSLPRAGTDKLTSRGKQNQSQSALTTIQIALPSTRMILMIPVAIAPGARLAAALR